MTDMPDLVDADWLAARLEAPDTIVFDASWYLPAQARDAEAEFAEAHIPGAARFDFDRDIAAKDTDLPHMLPAPDAFAKAVGALGVDAESRVVIYDGMGIFSAPRAWWMFKVMGHEAVAVLDGGLPAWRAAGHPVESGGPAPRAAATFTARPVPGRLADAARTGAALAGEGRVVDARPVARFEGSQPEPRPGLRAGHMPGAVNLPFDMLLDSEHLKPAEELRRIFASVGVGGGRGPVITTCGSGVTASVLALGAEVAGLGPVAVYDGSWSEWGQEGRTDLDVARGPA